MSERRRISGLGDKVREIKDKISPCKSLNNDFCNVETERMGRGRQRVSTGEGEGGQTHWLAAEERSGKRDGEENTRKSDSWSCPT